MLRVGALIQTALRRLPALVCLLLAASGASPQGRPAAAAWNLPGHAPHLLAHYMTWYQIDGAPGTKRGAWDHWKYEGKGPHHNPETRNSAGLRDIASVAYPLIGPYDSRSPAVIRYHLETARAAGIEGVIVDWYGRGEYTDKAMPALLDEAARLNMGVAICYEEKVNFLWRSLKTRAQAVAAATADLKYILTRYSVHPAYIRRNGRPVIFNFDGSGDSPMGPGLFLPDEFARIFADLPAPVAYCREGLTATYHPVVAGAFRWWSSDAGAIREFGERARRMVDAHSLDYFAGMISPGFDDTGVWGWGGGPRVTPRAGLSLLRHTFELSFTGDPELIQIVTWNDFNEGTVVEPTRGTGFQYLDAIATWWGEKMGRRVDLEAIREPFLRYARTCSPQQRAELPAAPFQRYLSAQPLTVAVPHYLDAQAPHNHRRR
jgi:glycoprotein endo-alpha-1,2-mannosidase